MSVPVAEGKLLESRYRFIRKLGAGGYGTVWLATDEKNGSRVAVKILHDSVQTNSSAVRRMGTEGSVLLSLSHPNIARAFAVRTDKKPCYLVIEFVDGVTLSDDMAGWGKRAAPIPYDLILRRLDHLASAIDAAHEIGVVHRDIKPANIMLTGRGNEEQVKLLDFGVARILDGEAWNDTTIGRRVGSPMYMAPEQVKGEHAVPQSDIFALGGIAYLMLTLRQPWVVGANGERLRAYVDPVPNTAGALRDTLVRILRGPRPRVSVFREGFPDGADKIVQRAVATEIEDRYTKASEFIADLREALADVRDTAASELTATRLVENKSETRTEAKNKTKTETKTEAKETRTSPRTRAVPRSAWKSWAFAIVLLGFASLIAFLALQRLKPATPAVDPIARPPVTTELVARPGQSPTPARGVAADPVVATSDAGPRPNQGTRRAKPRTRTKQKTSTTAAKSSAPIVAAQKNLAALQKNPSDAALLDRAAQNLRKAARTVQDDNKRARIERVIRTSVIVGDIDGLATALQQIKAAQAP